VYFRLLESINTKSFSDQLKSLHNFLNSHPDFASVFHKIYDLYIYNEKVSDAQNYFEQLTKSPKYRCNAYWILAKLHISQKQPEQALDAYQNALSAASPSFGLLKDFISFYYSQFNKIDMSYLKTLEINPKDELLASGLIYFSQSKFKETVEIFHKLPKQSLKNVYLLSILGRCYFRLRSYLKADSLYKKAFEISRENGNLKSEALLSMNLGILSSYVKEQNKKLDHLNLALKIARRINDLQLIQLISWNRGLYFETNYEFNAAKNEFHTATKIARKFNNYRKAAYSGYHYAQNLFNMRNFNDAIAGYDASERYAKILKDPYILFRIKISKGDIYYYLNQNELAEHVFQEALDIALSNDFPYRKHNANARLANVMVRMGNFKNARKIYHSYISYINKNNLHQRESEAYWLWKLAQTYLSEKKYDTAKFYFKQAMASAKKYNKKGDYEWSIMRLAELNEKIGNYSEALNLFNESLITAKKGSNTSQQSEIYLGLGNIFRKQKSYGKAINHYLLAAEIIENTRQNLEIEQFKIGYFKDEHRVYKNLVLCYLNRYLNEGKQVLLDSLFLYDQMARGRSLEELKLKNELPKGTGPDSLIYQQYSKACTNLQKGQRDLLLQTNINSVDELDLKLSQVEADKYSLIEQRLRLSGVNDSLKINQINSTICTLNEAQNNLKNQDIGLLLFNISEDKSFVLATNDSIHKIILLKTTPDSIKTLIDSLMTPFHNVKHKSVRQITFNADIGFRLYKLLIEPVEKVIQLPKKLLVVSDGAILNLPFEMLLSSKPKFITYTPTDKPDYADYFLLKKYSFSYAPNTSFLNKEPKQTAGRSKFLLFANPYRQMVLPDNFKNQLLIPSRWQFPPLPCAEIEANKIEKQIRHIKTFRHAKATESIFIEKAPDQRFIHLAAHGFVDLSFDAFSGIAFAAGDDSTDDGLLLGYEISDLDLNKCELITLSGCETGRGKTVAGEGVLGLPRSFLGAGAKSVLMTLWKVDDKFTSELMPEFYNNLFEKNLSKIDALAKAKLQLFEIKKQDIHHQHPFFWASFCLFGEPRSSKRIPLISVELILVIISIIIFFSFIVILSAKAIHTKKISKMST